MARTISRLRPVKVRRLADDINARLAAPPPGVSAETEILYRSFTAQALRVLRAAFKLDRDQALSQRDPRALQAFCQSRIDLITRILERKIE